MRALALAGLLTLGLLVVPEPDRIPLPMATASETTTRIADDLPRCPADDLCEAEGDGGAFRDEDGNRIDERLDRALAMSGDEGGMVEVRVAFDRAATVPLIEDLRAALGPFQVHEVWKGWGQGGMSATLRPGQVPVLAEHDAVLRIRGGLVRWV